MPAAPRRGLRKWLARLGLALGAPLLFLLLLEAALRLCGFGYDTAFLVRDPRDSAKLNDNYRFAWRFFPKSLARQPQPIRVAEVKPAGVRRVVIFGSSAAMGDPEPAYGMGRILAVLLRERFPNETFEIVNTATTAINSHVALPMARACVRLKADAWLVYMGNNEVLGPFGAGSVFGAQAPPLWAVRFRLAAEDTRTGQLFARTLKRGGDSVPAAWGGLEMFLDQKIRHDDPRLERVFHSFGRNVEDLARVGKKHGAKVLIGTIAVNQRDFAPFVSMHRAGLDEAALARWQAAFDEGRAAHGRRDWDAALAAYARAAEIDGDHAELRFQEAQVLLGMGHPERAVEKFSLALERDALPFRATARTNEAIRQAAERAGAIVVDGEGQFREAAMHKIPGEEFFLEHVHFNFTGNYLLARSFADALVQALGLANATPWLREPECREALIFTPLHEMQIVAGMRQRMQAPPFRDQSNQAERDDRLRRRQEMLERQMAAMRAEESLAKFQQTIQRRPDDWFHRKQYAALLESVGRWDEAVAQWTEITKLLPHYAAGHFQLGAQWNRLKRWKEAEESLRRAVAVKPEYPQAWNSLGICRSQQGDANEAYACFAKAVEVMPAYPEALVNWGMVLASRGDAGAAREKFDAALRSDPNYPNAHQQLALAATKSDDSAGAEKHYRELARILPNDPGAWINLGLALLKQGKPEAVTALEKGLALDPNNEVARQALARAKERSRS